VAVFVCESKDHVGDRRVQHSSDQFTVSLDIMRRGSTERLHRVKASDLRRIGVEIPERVCRSCANDIVLRCRPKMGQESML
jgi:hypothetical protein